MCIDDHCVLLCQRRKQHGAASYTISYDQMQRLQCSTFLYIVLFKRLSAAFLLCDACQESCYDALHCTVWHTADKLL
jgi:hypothetical protein